MSIEDKVIEQLNWELKRGKIEISDITVDYIEEVAEGVLDESEFNDLLDLRLATEIYQSF